MKRKLETIKMWFDRRMLRIPWKGYVSNEWFLWKMKIKKTLFLRIRKTHLWDIDRSKQWSKIWLIQNKRPMTELMSFCKSRTVIEIVKRQAWLRYIDDGKLWRAILAHMLNGHSIHNWQILKIKCWLFH